MTAEYQMLHRIFGWDEDYFKALNATALAAAFCDDNTKARVAKRLEPAQ
jgi:adenosine deaminase